MTLGISLLGHVNILVDDAPLSVDTRKAVALLAHLATMQSAQPRDVLAALLWPEYDQENARSSLRRTLSTLRRALGGRWVGGRGDAINLDSDGLNADVVEFRDALARVRSHRHDAAAPCNRCAEELSRAVDLYRGDFMSGFSLRDSPEFEDWQFAQAESLRRELDGALAALVAYREGLGQVHEAIVAAMRRLQLDRISEGAHADLMRLYALAGDRSSALKQYRECLRILDEELGVGPLESTTALYERIAAGELPPSADPPPAPLVTTARTPAELPFTGRDPELMALRTYLGTANAAPRVAVIEGEPGIGKSRLLSEALMGRPYFVGHCYEGEAGLAYAPVIGVLHSMLADGDARIRLTGLSDSDLSEGSRLLPALSQLRANIGTAPPLDSPASDVRFVEAVQSILLAGAGHEDGVLAFEDVHWADEATLNLLVFMARRLEQGDALVLTWRSDEVPEHHKLRNLLGELRRRQRTLHLVLDRLSASAVGELMRLASGEPSISPERLYEETDGVPLFVVEYLAAGATLEGDWPTPPTVADLARGRLRRLGERERQIVTTAAVIGRSFTFEVVRAASGRSEEETVSAIEALVANSVLRPTVGTLEDGPSYDFAHERLRSYVYESLDGSRRRLLHRRVAEALVQGTGSGIIAGQAAQHFFIAGDSTRAAQLFEVAGQKARDLHAHVEAVAHFRAALRAGHESPASLHRQIGELLILSGSYQGALTSLQLSAALSDGLALAEVEHQIGNVYLRLGAWEIAEQHLMSALEGAGGSPMRQAARVLTDLSLLMHRQGRNAEALKTAQEALENAQSAGDEQALAQAHNILGILATGSGHLDIAMRHLHECVRIAEVLGDDGARIAGLNNLALAQRAQGNHDSAAEIMAEALELCRGYGDRHREAALLNNLADISRDRGLEEESMDYLKQAVTVFAEVGAASGALEPEIWKLVKW